MHELKFTPAEVLQILDSYRGNILCVDNLSTEHLKSWWEERLKQCGQCKYVEAWIGRCKETTIGEDGLCPKHAGLVCSSCGKPSTHNCSETMGPFVCGFELCDNCEHALIADPDGYMGYRRTDNFKHCSTEENKEVVEKAKSLGTYVIVKGVCFKFVDTQFVSKAGNTFNFLSSVDGGFRTVSRDPIWDNLPIERSEKFEYDNQ